MVQVVATYKQNLQMSSSAVGVCLESRQGRVLRDNSELPKQALYTVGWAKRGPTGIIGAAASSFHNYNHVSYSHTYLACACRRVHML